MKVTPDEINSKWSTIALSTAAADRATAESAIRRCYSILGFEEPKIIWCASPLAARVAEGLLYFGGKISGKQELQWNFREQIAGRPALRDGFLARFGIEDRLTWDMSFELPGDYSVALAAEFYEIFFGEEFHYHDFPKAHLNPSRHEIPDSIFSEVWNDVASIIGATGEITGEHKAAVLTHIAKDVFGGQFLGGLHGFATAVFARNVSRLDFLLTNGYERGKDYGLKELVEIGVSAGMLLPYDGFCMVCERPAVLKTDERNQLHCVDGPAVVFRDGWPLYLLRGIGVPPNVVLQPELITVHDIEGQENAELRRVIMEQYGVARYLIDSGARETQRDECGILYSQPIEDDEPLVMVRVQNKTPELDGTYKEYFLRVPPEITTAREGVAWTFNIPPDEYEPTAET